MSVISFNVASVAAIPIQDIYGNAITLPTPIVIPGITSLDLNIKGGINKLMAEKQFAISGVRSNASIDGKFHGVQTSAELLSVLYSGQGYDNTTAFENVYINKGAIAEDQVSTTGYAQIPPADPSLGAELYIISNISYPTTGYQLGPNVVPGVPLGILDIYGHQWGTRVTGIPASAGQWYYGNSHITGNPDTCFSFYFPDIFPNYPTHPYGLGGKIPFCSFTTTQTAALPISSIYGHARISNVIAGSTPVVQLIIAASFQGKKLTIVLPWTISSDLNLLAMKNLEFSGYDMTFECFPDNTSNEVILEAFFIE